MNLTDIRQPQTAAQFANSMQDMFGVSVDIAKLNLDKSAQLLLSVNEEIQKQRLSEDRHKLHTTKSYLAKIFIKENLEKHINELEEAAGKMKKKKDCPEDVNLNEFSQDDEAAADADLDKVSKAGMYRKAPKKPALDKAAKMLKNDVNEEDLAEKYKGKDRRRNPKDWTFDPKGLVALRMLVGSSEMAKAKRAMEYAKQGRAVPAVYMGAFVPLIDILDDIMRSGMANVQVLRNLDKRAKTALGIKEELSNNLRTLGESQEDQAELLLASKDVVDRVQKAVDDLSKLRNEDLPPLLDAMRDEVGAEISGAYSNIAIPTLDQLVAANGVARETLSQASRILTGEEQVPQAMGAEEVPAEAPAEEVPAEEFQTADVAAGEEELGRAER